MEATNRFDSRPIRIAVVGTGTGVGKTHLSVALLHALALLGRSAVGLKPVESGLGASEDESDTSRLAAAGTFHVKHPAPYRFRDPVSPHLAARRVGVEIATERIIEWVAACAAPWTIIESAGGLLSPLGPALTNLDLVDLLRPDAVVLVGVDRLGVLHDVGACLVALTAKAPALPTPHVVLQAPEVADASTGTNAGELAILGMVAEAAVVPRGAPTETRVIETMRGLLERIERRVDAKCFT